MRRGICTTVVAAMLVAPSVAGGAVLRWGSYGSNNYGKKKTPTEVKFTSEPATLVKIDAGNAESFALAADGTLWAFGQNNAGQLGNGETGSKLKNLKAAPVDFPAGTDVVAIGEGRADGFAIDSTGQGWSWGRSASSTLRKTEANVSSLCLGPVEEDVTTPQPVAGLTHMKAVQGGGTHVLWLTGKGTVEACGANADGQLGTGDTTNSLTPTQVKGLPEVVEISAGKATSCARTASGEVYVWGYDGHGQVGDGKVKKAVLLPYHVPLPGPASEISCGGNSNLNGSTLALVKGVIYGWGADEVDQIGDAQNTDKASPTVASETLGLHVSQIVTSGESSLVLTTGGEVYGWGSNEGYALAMPESSTILAAPHLITTGALEISGTSYDALARTP